MQMDGQVVTSLELRREWKVNNMQAWEYIWEEHTESRWTHKIFPTIKNTWIQTTSPASGVARR